MCLNAVLSSEKEKIDKPLHAWKIFDYDGVNYHFPYYALRKSRKVPRGKWLKSSKVDIAANTGTIYNSGFHCYLTRKEARQAKIGGFRSVVKVECRGTILAVGEQDGVRVIVVEQIRVP